MVSDKEANEGAFLSQYIVHLHPQPTHSKMRASISLGKFGSVMLFMDDSASSCHPLNLFRSDGTRVSLIIAIFNLSLKGNIVTISNPRWGYCPTPGGFPTMVASFWGICNQTLEED